MRIRSIDAAMQARLKSAGVNRFSDMARWQPDDVARISQSLGLVGRIEQENWIEQAQILASGGETEYSRRRLRGDIPTVTPAPAAPVATPAAAAPVAPPASQTVSSSEGASAAAAAAAAAMASAAVARAAQVNVEPAMPVKLADAIREHEAKPEAAAGKDAASRVARPDLAGLRSVRSEALRDVTASEQLRSGGSARPMGAMEDLKRIRGIGVLIEKKLNSLGVSSYEQIANWTNADIDRVSQILDFKGRIERESWVEQARILASGGHTEFSKRVDRGEA
jgi:predicted flap endonuclease-1-like 5' DNA nuclease